MVEKHLENTGHWSSGPLRGLKRDLYEGGHRVPFLICGPGGVVADAVADENISRVDLFATFANVLGRSLKPSKSTIYKKTFPNQVVGVRNFRIGSRVPP